MEESKLLKNLSKKEQREKLKEQMCDQYCRYPRMKPPKGKNDGWLLEDDSPCQNCPLLEL